MKNKEEFQSLQRNTVTHAKLLLSAYVNQRCFDCAGREEIVLGKNMQSNIRRESIERSIEEKIRRK